MTRTELRLNKYYHCQLLWEVIIAIYTEGVSMSPDGCCMSGECRCNGTAAQFWPRLAAACWYIEHTGSMPRKVQLHKTRFSMATFTRWVKAAKAKLIAEGKWRVVIKGIIRFGAVFVVAFPAVTLLNRMGGTFGQMLFMAIGLGALFGAAFYLMDNRKKETR